MICTILRIWLLSGLCSICVHCRCELCFGSRLRHGQQSVKQCARSCMYVRQTWRANDGDLWSRNNGCHMCVFVFHFIHIFKYFVYYAFCAQAIKVTKHEVRRTAAYSSKCSLCNKVESYPGNSGAIRTSVFHSLPSSWKLRLLARNLRRIENIAKHSPYSTLGTLVSVERTRAIDAALARCSKGWENYSKIRFHSKIRFLIFFVSYLKILVKVQKPSAAIILIYFSSAL